MREIVAKTRDFWIAGGILLAGIVMIAIGSGQLWQGVRAYGWEQKPGVMLSSQIHRFRAPQSINIDLYQAEFFYRYQMGSHELTGSVLYPGYAAHNGRDAAEEWLDRFPEGAEVRVYVNPDKPKEAMLAPGIHLEYIFRPLAGLALIVMALYWLSCLRRR